MEEKDTAQQVERVFEKNRAGRLFFTWSQRIPMISSITIRNEREKRGPPPSVTAAIYNRDRPRSHPPSLHSCLWSFPPFITAYYIQLYISLHMCLLVYTTASEFTFLFLIRDPRTRRNCFLFFCCCWSGLIDRSKRVGTIVLQVFFF